MRAALLVVALSACGGPNKPETPRLEKENQITSLWTQIREFRQRAGMRVEPLPADVMSMAPRTVNQAEQVCPDGHEVPPTCSDICSLADAICDNAETICTIADELGKQDDYAQDKCKSAKASCKEGKERCCGCPAVQP